MDDPEAMRTIIEDIFLRQQLWTLLWVLLVALLSAGSAFLGAYLKQRGEHYATKQDFGNLLEQLKMNTSATEDIKARIGRRTDFEKQVLVEQYKLVSDLERRIVNIATNLNRHQQGIDIPDFFEDGDPASLTQVFSDLQSNRWLLNERFYTILLGQARTLLKIARGDSEQHMDEYFGYLEEFKQAMNEVFNIDKITWLATEEPNNQN